MAEVDPSDKNIKSFSVRHHRFDPETNHFRWFLVKSFDNEKEMNRLLELLWRDLEERNIMGESHLKEQIAGSIYDPKRAAKHPRSANYQLDESRLVYNFRRLAVFFAILRDAKFKFKKL